ncbi:hypothetical protein ACFQFC_03760 [Amorphoplanes digitatis]|uniref:Uncharacterized protein n=1 Tax=Actinoplanes digitatis TaxID=1868 RepID=A0A7W7MR62_9ACTN|nr:hypothetical protein [Actinoplanes digitatis]MBB4763295.1 hypothetical protein [Actinoplanes digitatis]
MWRDAPIRIPSSLSPAEAARRLTEARTASSFWSARAPLDGSRIVVGRVSTDEITLTARQAYVRNSWRPVLEARLEPVPGGCELVGTIGWNPLVRMFTAVWLTGAGLLTLGSLLAGLTFGTAEALAVTGAGLAMLSFGVALTTFGGRSGRRDGQFLKGWLDRHLSGNDHHASA